MPRSDRDRAYTADVCARTEAQLGQERHELCSSGFSGRPAKSGFSLAVRFRTRRESPRIHL